jgi:prevent-host-death family protein
MESVPVRVLNQDTASVLSRVENGEVIEITNRGKPIARIVPIGPHGLDDLIATGRVIAATSAGPIPMPEGEPDTLIDSTDIVSKLREERL